MFVRDGKQYVWPFVFIGLIVALFVAYLVLKSWADGTNPAFDYMVTTFLPHAGNVGIVILVLGWFGGPAISTMVTKRKELVERDIEESARQKLAAEKMLKDATSNLEVIDSEVNDLKTAYAETAAAQRQRIELDAARLVERIEQDAEKSFELQSNTAIKAFERELMMDAITKARLDIEGKLVRDPSQGARLIDRSIDELKIDMKLKEIKL